MTTDELMQFAQSGHHKLESAVLHRLIGDENPEHEPVLVYLASKGSHLTQMWLAEYWGDNWSTEALLAPLASNSDCRVRAELLANSSLPEELFDELRLNDMCEGVRG